MNPKIAPIIDNIAINEFPCIHQLSRNRNNDPESTARTDPTIPKICSNNLEVDLIIFIILY